MDGSIRWCMLYYVPSHSLVIPVLVSRGLSFHCHAPSKYTSKYLSCMVCVLRSKSFFFFLSVDIQHPAHPVSVPILPPRDTSSSLWSQNHGTKILHNAVIRVDNAITEKNERDKKQTKKKWNEIDEVKIKLKLKIKRRCRAPPPEETWQTKQNDTTRCFGHRRRFFWGASRYLLASLYWF